MPEKDFPKFSIDIKVEVVSLTSPNASFANIK